MTLNDGHVPHSAALIPQETAMSGVRISQRNLISARIYEEGKA